MHATRPFHQPKQLEEKVDYDLETLRKWNEGKKQKKGLRKSHRVVTYCNDGQTCFY